MNVKFPQTLEDVEAFLVTQQPDALYQPGNSETCILCHLMKSYGVERPFVGLEVLMDYHGINSVKVPCPAPLRVLQERWIKLSYGASAPRRSWVTAKQALRMVKTVRRELQGQP